MNELEKCMAGEYYDCHDKIFLDFKTHARELLKKYNALAYEQKEEKVNILKQLFGGIGVNVSVGLPFICDYGRNIYIGNNVSVNMNCTFVDCNKITIGDNVLIASNVQLYTATHPVELSERLTPNWSPETEQYFCRTYALPIKIGSGCWLGGGVIVLPGVTIGNGSVIGAGSVVTKDIPENSLAVGNPCRVIRKINKKAISKEKSQQAYQNFQQYRKNYIKEMRKDVGHAPLMGTGCGVIIENDKGEILLQKRRDNGCWALLGGFMEIGEKFVEAAKREVYEEAGIEIGELTLFGIYSGEDGIITYPNGDVCCVTGIVFKTTVYSGEIKNNTEEALEHRFFDKASLPDNINEYDKRCIIDWAKGLQQVIVD